ncbi:aldo/keto reductase [Vibrio astriarenae]
MMQSLPIHRRLPQASQLVYGCMGLGGGWNDNPVSEQDIQQTHQVIDCALEEGINQFDHADIYTFTKAEQAFGQVMKVRPELREQISIQSKCAIRFADEKGPKRYDFSAEWIEHSVEHILRRLHIEQLDVLLLHRPDPLMVTEEVASIVDKLQRTGKIGHLGVSNMNVPQMSLLQSALNTPIVCNQLELSLSNLQWLEEGVTHNSSSFLGTIEYCRAHGIQLQAWGCLSQGLFTGRDLSGQPEHIVRTANLVQSLAEHYQTSKEAIVLAWIMRHPAHIQPVIGTTNLERIRACALASNLTLTHEEWYRLYESARGNELP